jgi:DNA-binding NarL/FixJ family response regulator
LALLRILVVDDFPFWRQFISRMLQERPDFQVIGEASDGLEAIHKSAELQPDLILLDIGLPKLNGIQAARKICAVAPGSTILFVSENQSPTAMQEAMHVCEHARGYIVKSNIAYDLFPALEAVMQGKQSLAAELDMSAIFPTRKRIRSPMFVVRKECDQRASYVDEVMPCL